MTSTANYNSDSLKMRKTSASSATLHSQSSLNSNSSIAHAFGAPQRENQKFIHRASSGSALSRTTSTGAAMSTGGRRPPRQSESVGGMTLSNKLLGLSEGNYHKRERSVDDDEHKRRLTVDDPCTDVSPSGTLKSKPSASKLAQMFSVHPSSAKEKEKLEILCGLLDQWEKNGLPDFPILAEIDLPKFEMEKYTLEEHWTNFIDKTGLSQKQKDQQEALWELLYTEVEYIKSLYVIHELFMCCLLNAQNDGVLNDVNLDQMFSSITGVTKINTQFWETELIQVLEHSRTNKCLFDPKLLKPAFTNFGHKFGQYTRYCIEQGECSEYVKNKYKEDILFKTFVLWAEQHKQCNRLKLHDLLVKPMQRITRYSLLLRAISKKTEDEETKQVLMEMIERVDKFVAGVDHTLKRKHEKERLQAMTDRIETYDAIDVPLSDPEMNKVLVDNYMSLNLMSEMPGCNDQLRYVLHEGPLKLKEMNTKMDVYCILFTDMLLFTKHRARDKLKIVKPPIKIDCLSIHEMKESPYILLVHLTEFNVAQAAYTLHGDDLNKWVKSFRKAQTMYRKAREQARSESHVLSPTLSTDLDDFGFSGPLHRQESDSFTVNNRTPSYNSLNETEVTANAVAPGPVDPETRTSPEIGRKHHTLPSNYKHRRKSQIEEESGQKPHRRRKHAGVDKPGSSVPIRSKSSAAAIQVDVSRRTDVHNVRDRTSSASQYDSSQSSPSADQSSFSSDNENPLESTLTNKTHSKPDCSLTPFETGASDIDVTGNSNQTNDNLTPTNSQPADGQFYQQYNSRPNTVSAPTPHPRKLSQLELKRIKRKQMEILLDQSVGVEI